MLNNHQLCLFIFILSKAVSSEGAEDKGLNKKFMWNDVSLETSGQCPPSPGGHSSVTSYPCSTAFSERSVSDIWSFFSGDTRGSIAYPPPTPLNGTLEAGSMPYPSPAQLSGTFDWGFMGHPSSKKKRPYPSQNHAQNPVITKDANRT
ncbi:uncharacterized protein LOC117104030 [Anneissia japonica]|uniref:uncharacterized protein LOC117104030 n=1 Tax=Anneissia japonica TaxID=1529436 RepID=UPI0014255002|nr:uncharacterized protein LOC117104030 [Anneissia japonica]